MSTQSEQRGVLGDKYLLLQESRLLIYIVYNENDKLQWTGGFLASNHWFHWRKVDKDKESSLIRNRCCRNLAGRAEGRAARLHLRRRCAGY